MKQRSLSQKFLQKLDRANFLNFGLWEFSINSLSRFYGIFFLWTVVLPHFLKTVRGLRSYQRFLKKPWQGDVLCLSWAAEESLLSKMKGRGRETLIGIGYCQKPMNTASQSCPAGRANHVCSYFESLNLDNPPAVFPSRVCKTCGVRVIGEMTLAAGARLYIMTSALDIARDIFIPTLKHQKFSYVFLLLCPYSLRAIILPLLICGLEGFLVPYRKGDCKDYGQFLQADRGLKSEQTYLAEETLEKVLKIIDAFAPEANGDRKPDCKGFIRQGNIYVPFA